MTKDQFANFARSAGGPADDAFPIIPSAAVQPKLANVIYVGTGGDVALVPWKGDAPVIYRNVPSGSYLTVRTDLVLPSGTTASDLVGEA